MYRKPATKESYLKFGKLPATDYGDKNVLLTSVLTAPLPTAPKHFGHATLYTDWGMLGNDRYGDCTCAGSDHEHMLWTALGRGKSKGAQFTTANTLSDYSAISGFDPNNPSTDNGAAVDHVMDYRRTVGMIDSAGQRHKIDLGVRLPGHQGSFDWQQFINCVWAFKAVAIGTLIPSSAQQQFASGEPWDYVGDQNIEGGHYIPAVASTSSGRQVTILTWGRQQVMTRSFFEAYVDELWVPLSQEAMSAIKSALHVIDWTSVQRIASSL
jgi:hypothetical protein